MSSEFAADLKGAFQASVSVRLVYLYLSVCIYKTKEQDLRVPNGQLNRRVGIFDLAFSGQLTRWLWQSPESRGDAGGDLQRLIEERNLQHL